ncbi:hypothetical protein BB559_007495 [Furculomyces boomerangus]|uniref:Major facilitator superfamily (MFS) profile domain-containing protein n=2 Tax=Furculomyces boomerangus TaxID=61424 RepID=A0A2T9XX62_9FUNG|nr:hypothetical protein BB559_007495 [Furculomyces boomerangus]
MNSNVAESSNSQSTKDIEYIPNTSKDIQETICEIPPDKGYAWLMLIAGVLNYMVSFGSISSFCVLETYYVLNMFPGISKLNVSLISTIGISSMYVGGILGQPLIARFGLSGANCIGSFIGAIGIFFASFCTEIWQLVITQGLIFGIGSSIVMNVSLLIPSLWFEKYLGLALGTVISGSSLGTFILYPITTAALKAFGIQWTLRLLSLTFLLFTGFGSVLIKPRKEFFASKKIINLKHLKDPITVLLCASYFIFQMGFILIVLYFPLSVIALGKSSYYAAKLSTIFGVSSALGRILSGCLANRFGCINIIMFSHAVVGTVMILIWGLGKSVEVYIVAYILMGIFSVPYFVLGRVIIAKRYPSNYVSQVNGLMSLMMGIAVLIIVPVAGVAFDVKKYEIISWDIS